MEFNDIYVPLRIAAFTIAGVIGLIILLCSFNHPFDMHVHLDDVIKEAEMKVFQDQYDKLMYEMRIDYERNLPDPNVNIDHSGTYERYTEGYGTYAD